MRYDLNDLTLCMLETDDVVVRHLIDVGMSATEAEAKRARFSTAATTLIAAGHARSESAVAVFVPGRIEIFGKHTDYCGGRSLLCVVERGQCFVAVGQDREHVRFFAVDLHEQADLSPTIVPDVAASHWSHYPSNVVRRIARNFPGVFGGADIAMSSDLPKASGLSSSSAMIVGTFMVLASLHKLSSHAIYARNLPDRESLAGYLGTIENGQSFGEFAGDRGVGTFGGSQDHTAILGCRPGHVSVYSFCPVRHHSDLPLAAGMTFVVADSGVIAEKTGDANAKYNSLSAGVRDIVSLWRDANGTGDSLNEILNSSPDALSRMREIIQRECPQDAPVLLDRVEQFVIESNNLIPRAADAFARSDWEALRSIASQSHQYADTHLRNQTPQTNALQRALLENGAIAASAFGAGFGGSVWGLFDERGLARWRESDVASQVPWFPTRPGCAATLIGG